MTNPKPTPTKMARSDKLRDVGLPGQTWTTGVVSFTLKRYCAITDQWSCVYHQNCRDYDGYIGGDAITSFMALLDNN